MVTRTFSKVYSLAGLRVGYAVTAPETINELRRIQLPFTVNTLAEVAAVEALKYQDRVRERGTQCRRRRSHRCTPVAGIPVADSQTNFVYTNFGAARARLPKVCSKRIHRAPRTPRWLAEDHSGRAGGE